MRKDLVQRVDAFAQGCGFGEEGDDSLHGLHCGEEQQLEYDHVADGNRASCGESSGYAGYHVMYFVSENEEADWIKRLSEGDEEAREQLIVHNLRLVAHIARKYEKSPSDRDDLISCGTIGLIKAVSTYADGKGALSAYASRCIENEILMSYRRDRKLVQTVSLEEAVGQDKEGNDLPLAELLASEDDPIFDQVLRRLDADRVYDAMRKHLSKREQSVLSLRNARPTRRSASWLGRRDADAAAGSGGAFGHFAQLCIAHRVQSARKAPESAHRMKTYKKLREKKDFSMVRGK